MINIKATNLKLDKAINRYIDKRVGKAIKKFGKEGETSCYMEVAKTTNHHNKGDIFRAEINLSIDDNVFRAVSEKDDLYLAIDSAKDEIVRIIKKARGKKRTLIKRGGTSVKKMVKRLSNRNPFTSK